MPIKNKQERLWAIGEIRGLITLLMADDVAGLAAHLADASDAHDASAISNVPAGGIAAIDVQAALNELDTEKAGAADLAAHVAIDLMDGDPAGGVLSGAYPSPGFAVDMATQAELDAMANESFVVLGLTADLPNERVLTGTANQIIVTDGGAGGAVTLSTPQNIHTGASPTFVGLNLGSGQVVLFGAGGSGSSGYLRSEILYVGGVGAGISSTIQIGKAGATGNRNSYIDFATDDTYTDYSLRIMRWNGGPNTDSAIYHRGTGGFWLYAVDAGYLNFVTSNASRLQILSAGGFIMSLASPGGPYGDWAGLGVTDVTAGRADFLIRTEDNRVGRIFNSECTATHTTTQNLPNAAWTDIALNSEVSDDEGWHDPVTNNPRITVHEAGTYMALMENFGINAACTNLPLWFRIMDNAGNEWNYGERIVPTADWPRFSLAGVRSMSAGGFIYCQVYNGTGAAKTLNAYCKLTLIKIH